MKKFNCKRCGQFSTLGVGIDGEGYFCQRCLIKIAKLKNNG